MLLSTLFADGADPIQVAPSPDVSKADDQDSEEDHNVDDGQQSQSLSVLR